VGIDHRSIRTYLGDGSARFRQVWVDGSGINPRVTLAARRTLESGGQQPVPSQCGGHLQIAC
jgi:hypothetical protein